MKGGRHGWVCEMATAMSKREKGGRGRGKVQGKGKDKGKQACFRRPSRHGAVLSQRKLKWARRG
jgi:hypothetical protein